MSNKERLEEMKNKVTGLTDSEGYFADAVSMDVGVYAWFYKQAERVHELEFYVEENSKKHANLNVFLQERNTTSTLGKHVVDAIMQYVQELEEHNRFLGRAHQANLKISEYAQEQNKRYREALEEILDSSTNDIAEFLARKALEGSK